MGLNADDFYEHFKETLRFLGPGWAGKDKVIVSIKDNKIVYRFEHETVTLDVNSTISWSEKIPEPKPEPPPLKKIRLPFWRRRMWRS
jgi:hypothetical protein